MMTLQPDAGMFLEDRSAVICPVCKKRVGFYRLRRLNESPFTGPAHYRGHGDCAGSHAKMDDGY